MIFINTDRRKTNRQITLFKMYKNVLRDMLTIIPIDDKVKSIKVCKEILNSA